MYSADRTTADRKEVLASMAVAGKLWLASKRTKKGYALEKLGPCAYQNEEKVLTAATRATGVAEDAGDAAAAAARTAGQQGRNGGSVVRSGVRCMDAKWQPTRSM
jgi:hypothetical protein